MVSHSRSRAIGKGHSPAPASILGAKRLSKRAALGKLDVPFPTIYERGQVTILDNDAGRKEMTKKNLVYLIVGAAMQVAVSCSLELVGIHPDPCQQVLAAIILVSIAVAVSLTK